MTSQLPYAEVIGDPIKHSKSPVIHEFWLGKTGIAGTYRCSRVGTSELEAYLAARRHDPLWRGCNVTMPLKSAALQFADKTIAPADQAAAINLLRPTGEGLVADNKDVGAIVRVVEALTGGRRPASVTVLGTGGAARAALVALTSIGVRDVVVQARNTPAAAKLAEQFALGLSVQRFGEAITTEGLINATPLGMVGAPKQRVDLRGMPEAGWVFDLVSVPDPTSLIREAREQRLRAEGGLSMLVEQAATSFSAFFNAEAPREHDAELMRLLNA